MKYLFILMSLISLPSFATPLQVAIEVGCCGASQSINTDVDIKNTQYLNLRGRYMFGQYWGAELALGGFNDLQTATEQDNAGEYYLDFKSREFMLGIFAQYPISDAWQLNASAGALRYRTTVTLHESYLGVQPDTHESSDEQGNGYYANLGLRWYYKHLSLGPDVIYRKQLELFPDSSRPFDITTQGLQAVIGIRF